MEERVHALGTAGRTSNIHYELFPWHGSAQPSNTGLECLGHCVHQTTTCSGIMIAVIMYRTVQAITQQWQQGHQLYHRRKGSMVIHTVVQLYSHRKLLWLPQCCTVHVWVLIVPYSCVHDWLDKHRPAKNCPLKSAGQTIPLYEHLGLRVL